MTWKLEVRTTGRPLEQHEPRREVGNFRVQKFNVVGCRGDEYREALILHRQGRPYTIKEQSVDGAVQRGDGGRT